MEFQYELYHKLLLNHNDCINFRLQFQNLKNFHNHIFYCKKEVSNSNAITNYEQPKVLEGGKFIEFSKNHPLILKTN